MNKYLYGIDFGTSNSALSIFDEERNKIVETITIPSILYFPKELDQTDEIIYTVGKHAIQEYLNDGMQGRFMKSIKRVLPRSSFIDTRVGSHKLTAANLVTFIIKDLKQKADALVGEDCKKAIFGRPVFFDDDDASKDELAQKRLRLAAEKAGFEQIAFQFEPIGAAFAYEQSIKQKERVLVADLGGGTTDFTFIELNPKRNEKKDRREDILATGGIYIGGDSFDATFMYQQGTPHFGRGVLYESSPGKMLDLPLSFFTNICSWEKMNFFNGQKTKNDLGRYFYLSKNNPKFKNLLTLTEHNLGYSIFQAIEKTKVELSNSLHSKFQYKHLGIEINDHINLESYNQMIEKDLNKISQYLDTFLVQHQIKTTDINSIFLTGGSSLVQSVQQLFKQKFPYTPINSGDNFISVAKGLAYSGYLFDEL